MKDGEEGLPRGRCCLSRPGSYKGVCLGIGPRTGSEGKLKCPETGLPNHQTSSTETACGLAYASGLFRAPFLIFELVYNSGSR